MTDSRRRAKRTANQIGQTCLGWTASKRHPLQGLQNALRVRYRAGCMQETTSRLEPTPSARVPGGCSLHTNQASLGWQERTGTNFAAASRRGKCAGPCRARMEAAFVVDDPLTRHERLGGTVQPVIFPKKLNQLEGVARSTRSPLECLDLRKLCFRGAATSCRGSSHWRNSFGRPTTVK
jgi:hypothetical protein